MTEHTATAEHAHVEHAHDDHGHDDHGHDSPENIKKEIRVYLAVLGGLMVLTIVTVWLCFGLKMPMHYAIMIALAVASVKGFLVAAYFMHLLSEKKVIYAVLIVTVVFFGVLIWGPWHSNYDAFGTHKDQAPAHGESAPGH